MLFSKHCFKWCRSLVGESVNSMTAICRVLVTMYWKERDLFDCHCYDSHTITCQTLSSTHLDMFAQEETLSSQSTSMIGFHSLYSIDFLSIIIFSRFAIMSCSSCLFLCLSSSFTFFSNSLAFLSSSLSWASLSEMKNMKFM